MALQKIRGLIPSIEKSYVLLAGYMERRGMSDEYFMKKALALAEKAFVSGDFPVGCVIANQTDVIAEGLRQCSAGKYPNEVDHAEILALRSLYGTRALSDPKKLTVYCTMEPCLMCFGAILISGISRIVYGYEDVMGGGTGCDLSGTSPLYQKNDMRIVPHVLRQQSLALFKQFFARPENSYWKNSLLAEYTLAQE